MLSVACPESHPRGDAAARSAVCPTPPQRGAAAILSVACPAPPCGGHVGAAREGREGERG